MARRRNDASWRMAVLARYGASCKACGYGAVQMLQIDHMKPRSQGGQSDPENGLVLCGPFTPGRCHDLKTAGELKIQRDWLHPEQQEYLKAVGWVWWDDEGEVYGPGRNHFVGLDATPS